MVCAKQDQSAAVLVTKEEPNLDHLQQQHMYNNQQSQTQNNSNITTIVLFTRTNDEQHLQNHQQPQQQQQQQELTITTTLPQQRHQSLLAVKSQQLKKQHASLVKLLESAPITTTPTKCMPSPVVAKGSLTQKETQSEQNQQHIVFLQETKNIYQQTTNQPQQHKRLKTNNNNNSVIITHIPTTKIQQEQNNLEQKSQNNLEQKAQISTAFTTLSKENNNYINNYNNRNSNHNKNSKLNKKNSVSMSYEKDTLQQSPANFECEISPMKEHAQQQHQRTMKAEVGLDKETLRSANKIDNESGIDEEDIGMWSGEDEHHKKLISNNKKNGNTIENKCYYEHYQCPWKKIRYAREWKQRQQQQNQQQKLDIEQNLLQTHKEITIMLQQQKQEVEELPKQQQLNQCQQKQRRDSTDSNSSMLSNSSTHSSINNKNPTNFCTCNINKANIPQSLQQTMNDEFEQQKHQEQQQIDNDSGCDDEVVLCAEHQQLQMNFLCQKFDDSLETSEHNLNQEDNFDSETNESNLNGFFRRSIQQKIQYRPCTKNQQCSILRINRNRCQYCRLKKCIAVGMSRDAVRFGRVPKREKARILAAMQQSTQNRGQQRALATELDDQPRLLSAVLRAHLDTCEFTKEKVLDMRQKARDCPSFSMPTLLACPLNPAPELQSEQEFSQRFAHIIRGVIDFAGMIPGFQLLTQDDKFTLLKAGLFDALFVRLICMFDSSINSIICLNGQVMRRDAIQNGANARFLVDSTFNFAERMNSMNLSDAEIGLFCAIVLITPDRPGLRNTELVEKMYSRLKGCLQTVINQNRPDQPEFMIKLLETLPDLRTLSTLHTEKLVVFRTEHKEMLRQQMWSLDDDVPRANSKSPPASSTSSIGGGWLGEELDAQLDVMAVGGTSSIYGATKSQLSYVSSTETAGENEDNTTKKDHVLMSHNASTHNSQPHFPLISCCSQQQQPSVSSLASTAPLLAATLSSGSNISSQSRNRANSGSSGDSGTADLDLIVGSHAHLTQNGLTITPIARSAPQQQQMHHHLNATATVNRYRKLDSPTDSGIESGNEKNECGSKAVSSGGSSSCSSPRSSVDDALDCTEANSAAVASVARCPQQMTLSSSSVASLASAVPSANALKRQIVDDMPVLKRVLQAPPLYDTNSLMDEAYKPHKKFRAMRHREFETAEADASCSTSSLSSTHSSAPASMAATTITTTPFSREHTPPPMVTATTSVATQPPPANSQLQMLVTRPPALNQMSSSSFLSSTHSVLAKSLLAEPRMTPEQIKRSDIIQNYIMRESSPTSSASSSTPTRLGSRSPAITQQQQIVPGELGLSQQQHDFLHNHALGHIQRHPPTSSNISNVSNTTNSLVESAPPSPSRWQTQTNHHHVHNGNGSASVITATTNSNQRSISEVPGNNKHYQYSQSPHSTSSSASLNPSSSAVCVSSPNLPELQVDIADSQQPLNLSKKSPTPPPNNLQALVAAATTVQQQHRYNSAVPTVSADVKLTATNSSTLAETEADRSSSSKSTSTPSSKTVVHHKVLLEA